MLQSEIPEYHGKLTENPLPPIWPSTIWLIISFFLLLLWLMWLVPGCDDSRRTTIINPAPISNCDSLQEILDCYENWFAEYEKHHRQGHCPEAPECFVNPDSCE